MRELFFGTVERGFTLGVVMAVILLFRRRKGLFYSGAVWRMLWIGFAILLILPIRLPGLTLFELNPNTLGRQLMRQDIFETMRQKWMQRYPGAEGIGAEGIEDASGIKNLADTKYLGEFTEESTAETAAESIGDGSARNASGDSAWDTAQGADNDAANSAAGGTGDKMRLATTLSLTEEEMRREIRDSIITDNRISPVWQVLAYIWFAGCCMFMMWSLLKYLWWRRTILCHNRRVTSPALLQAAEKAAETCGVKTPDLYKNVRITSPVLVGLFHPVIIVPSGRATEESVQWALLHECMHKRKRDVWLRSLWTVICGIYWYNPFIWKARSAMAEDLEAACDESVLRGKDACDYVAYSEAMLYFVRPRKAPVSQLCFSVDKDRLAARFRRIFISHAKKRGGRLLAVALSVGILITSVVSCGTAESAADFKDTEELVICYDDTEYGSGFLSPSATYVNNVITYYTAQHPDVKVTLKGISAAGDTVESQAERKRLKTEIMAGEGPDLVLCTENDIMENPQKQMEAGLFCDLTPYMEKSEEISKENVLNEKFLQVGVYDNKQYLMPLNYYVYHFITGEKMLEKFGFDKENCKDRKGFLDEVEKFYESTGSRIALTAAYRNPDNTVSNIYSRSFFTLFPQFFDDTEGGLPLDEEEVKKWFSLYKQEIGIQQETAVEYLEGKFGENYLWETSLGRDILYMEDESIYSDTLSFMPLQEKAEGVTAAVHSWAAILEGAKNKKNAWDFIELMLNYNSQRLSVLDGLMPVRTDLGSEITEQMNQHTFYDREDRMDEWRRLQQEIADSMANVQEAL
ncbi:extracellular solute-binding protein [Blautia schinkii]|nr:extracellular solute-binding protein [Blautia schinkii]